MAEETLFQEILATTNILAKNADIIKVYLSDKDVQGFYADLKKVHARFRFDPMLPGKLIDLYKKYPGITELSTDAQGDQVLHFNPVPSSGEKQNDKKSADQKEEMIIAIGNEVVNILSNMDTIYPELFDPNE